MMDNTRKRKIVRNFVIGYLLLQVLVIVLYLGFWAVHPGGFVVAENERMSPPPMFPDYQGVTIPYNIAPLNFRIDVPAEKCYAKIEGSEQGVFEYYGTNTICFKSKDWERLTRANKGKAFFVTITTKEGDEWTKWAPFSVYISDQAIDSHLVYRLIEPGYEKWHIVGIYQRNLESFDEQPIIRNDMTGYNCMNCHSFCMGDPGQMMFHMRAANGGTYIVQDKKISKLITKDAFETFPAFSPDGKWLYFCTAPAQKMPENYDKVRYNLCRVAFDPDRGEISFPIDTLVHADSLSYTFPRISPDGRFLMYTETAYGQFPIWHPDAEIRMMDLENRTAMDMSALNSPDTDSYHSWSSNSDWVVFSSRRDNGLYTLPYICHIGKDGKPSKPFLLPQEDPDKYDYQLYSYNIPELTKGAVEVSPYEIQQVAEKNKPEQVRFK